MRPLDVCQSDICLACGHAVGEHGHGCPPALPAGMTRPKDSAS